MVCVGAGNNRNIKQGGIYEVRDRTDRTLRLKHINSTVEVKGDYFAYRFRRATTAEKMAERTQEPEVSPSETAPLHPWVVVSDGWPSAWRFYTKTCAEEFAVKLAEKFPHATVEILLAVSRIEHQSITRPVVVSVPAP